MKSYLALLTLVAVFMSVYIQTAEADHGHGHGHGHYAKGTACIVKGSYCNCHYCKCEKGHIHCGGYGHHGHGKYPRCLKITEKVSFNIASEASYVYILNGQTENGPFWRVFENLKLAVKQCYQTGQF